MNLTLAILTAEKEYGRQLADYMNWKKDFIYHAIAFSDEALLRDYSREHHISMLLCDEETALCSGSEFNADEICVLSDYSYVNDQAIYPSIYKYQSTEKILSELAKIQKKRKTKQDNERAIRNGKRRIISVCSPIGGCGKSTFALALADYYAGLGRTLFITFDPFFVIPGTKKNLTGTGLTEILYTATESGRELPSTVAGAVRKWGRLEYIDGVSHWFDLYSPKEEHIRRFMEVLKAADMYETIVIDVGVLTGSSTEILTNSSVLYIPVKSIEGAASHIEEWRRQLKFAAIEIREGSDTQVIIPFDARLECGQYNAEDLRRGPLYDCICSLVPAGGDSE